MTYTGAYKTACDVCGATVEKATIWSFVWRGLMRGRCRKHLADEQETGTGL